MVHIGSSDERFAFGINRSGSVSARASAGVVYTPQLVLDGRDLRQGYNVEHLRTRLAAINREKGQARIRADIRSSAYDVRISGEVELLSPSGGKSAQTWIAAFENGLSSRVTAGENAGATVAARGATILKCCASLHRGRTGR